MNKYLLILISLIMVVILSIPVHADVGGSVGDPSWQTVVLVGTDNVSTTTAIDLGKAFQDLNVVLPTITSCNITITMSTDNTTYYPIGASGTLIANSTGGFLSTSTISGARWVKLSFSENQTASRTLLVRGWNP
jgi:hypothetical protein